MADFEENTAPAKAPSLLTSTLRKFIFSIAVLLAVWVVFGQVIPRTLFAPAVQKPEAEKTEESPEAPATSAAMITTLNDLSARLAQDEAKIEALENIITTGAHPTVETTASSPDSERLSHIEASLAESEEALKSLKKQLDEVQKSGEHKLLAMTLLAQLKDRIQSGQPYDATLNQLKPLTATREDIKPLIDTLAAHSANGIATLETLKSEFALAVQKTLAAAPEKTSLLSNLSSLIRIRKVGEQTGNDAEAVIARAESRLDKGLINAASMELTSLPPAAATNFSVWQDLAGASSKIHSALDQLEAALLQQPPAGDAATSHD